MRRAVLFFLVCSMAFSAVSALSDPIILPSEVKNNDNRCKTAGHLGECWENNIRGLYPHCDKTACAMNTPGQKKKLKLIDNAPNGLKCGPNKVCWRGSCINLPAGLSMPRQSMSLIVTLYQCYDPDTKTIPGRH